MKKITVCIAASLGILFIGDVLCLADETFSFKLIVHASNPVSELTKIEISNLFLKKVNKWKESGETVLPVDLIEDSVVRAQFSESLHERKIASIKAYWQKQIFSGRGIPPEEKKSEEEVLEYVSENLGAIGYIAVPTPIDAYNVKVLTIKER
ncbi:hypothetical protein U27_05813 [Candidatus Vecturithrix granuli]|uniref:Phosphate ABC transporter substrate-binding protein n=1 Tax=Vecturithrix granuli TaxID=1499967 RepID=A0A081C2N3_VECG1|nr:hypothetical protein U27_05813 [Candidatus Vecturithrix granuli]